MVRKVALRSLILFAILALTLNACSSSDDDDGGTSAECKSLCSKAPSTGMVEGQCVDSEFTSRGYDTDTSACNALSAQWAQGQATEDQCNSCSASFSPSASDCKTVEATCFN